MSHQSNKETWREILTENLDDLGLNEKWSISLKLANSIKIAEHIITNIEFFYLITEGGDFFVTENGDKLIG